MKTYILKRLLLSIPMLFGITFISFFVMQLAPGQAGQSGGGEMSAGKLNSQQYKVMNESFHLDKSIYVRYFYWLGIVQPEPTEAQAEKMLKHGTPPPNHGIIYGDFGNSMETQSLSVLDILKDAIPITILLNAISLLLIYSLAIPIGIYSATHQYSLGDRISTVGLFMLFSMPSFWVAILLIKFMVILPGSWTIDFHGCKIYAIAPLLLAAGFLKWKRAHLKWIWLPLGLGLALALLPNRFLFTVPAWFTLPIHGYQPDDSDQLTTIQWLWSCGKFWILPVIAMSYAGLAGISRYMRSSMIDVIHADFVRVARAKGLREFVVIYKHALRNSLIPILTLLGGLLPELIGGSVILEAIFGIPGMGFVAYKALLARDYTVLMADVTLVAVLVMIGFILSDVLYTIADPRISFEKAK